jgi:hypothetical protein
MARFANQFRQALIGIMLFGATVCGASGEQIAGAIKFVKGSVDVIHAPTARLPIAVGQRVFPGDRVITGEDGYVGLTLHDDTRLSLGPRSELLIKEFEFNLSTYVGKMAISLLKGTAMAVTGLIGKHSPERVNLATQTATVGIRGTEFIMEVEPTD